MLESETIISYKMGKNKKHRMRKAKENEAEDSSDDAAQGHTSHLCFIITFIIVPFYFPPGLPNINIWTNYYTGQQ